MASTVTINGQVYDMTHFAMTFNDFDFEPRSITSIGFSTARTSSDVFDSRGVKYGEVQGDLAPTIDPIDMSLEEIEYLVSKFADEDAMTHRDTGEFTFAITAQKGNRTFSWEFQKCCIRSVSNSVSRNAEARGSITMTCIAIKRSHTA